MQTSSSVMVTSSWKCDFWVLPFYAFFQMVINNSCWSFHSKVVAFYRAAGHQIKPRSNLNLSELHRVPIPTQCGHWFRSKVATHSEARWPHIPIHCGRPFRSNLATPEGVIEAALDNPFSGHYPFKKQFRRSEWLRGDYPCARSKRYYVFILKKVSQPAISRG